MKKKSAPAPASKTMTLRAAFKQALSERGAFVPLRMARQTMLNQRMEVNKGEYPGDKTMRMRLTYAGWRMAVEEQWVQRSAPPAKAKKPAKAKPAKKKK